MIGKCFKLIFLNSNINLIIYFRILTLIENLSTAPLPKNWNRLMSLQGVFTNIGINFLNVSISTHKRDEGLGGS